MQVTAFAVSLNVADVPASAAWLSEHFGFVEQMAADGFCSLHHEQSGANLIYLALGLATFKPAEAAGPADGVLVVFTVDDVDAEFSRLVGEGVRIVTPLETEPWGERYFQVSDPNGVIYQLVQWVDPPAR
jgi:uncharacterized glyoxalase superfamily protein PhnB